MGYRIINGQAYRVGSIEDIKTNEVKRETKVQNQGPSFKEVLNRTLKEKQSYSISKHAADRLKEINFTEEDMKKIENGFEIAKNKGSRNTVMLYKDVALIASVENKTVITAVEKERAKENCFTNIDSVVIL